MSYQSKVAEIHTAFLMGLQDRDTCMAQFEDLLHEYGLLPPDERLDRTITTESFLILLKVAKEHRVPERKPVPEAKDEESPFPTLASIVGRHCPLCQQPTASLYNRVQDPNHQTIPIDPPRCQSCMTKWVKERFDIDQEHSDVPDDSFAVPMSASEVSFFAQYERQMQEKSE